MMREKRRVCDRCESEIPLSAFYRRLYCKPGAAAAYLGSSPPARELSGLDGTIRLDICAECAKKSAVT